MKSVAVGRRWIATRNWRGNEVGSFRCGGRVTASMVGYLAEAWAGDENGRRETLVHRMLLTENVAKRAVERWLARHTNLREKGQRR